MPDIESMVTGGLSGLLSTILVAVGLDRRVARVEREKMDKETFAQFEKRFDRLERTLQELPERVGEKVNGHWDGHDRRQR
jgi:hypothetical protein